MRIIHTVPAIAEEASGPSYCVVRLCESLIEAGEEVTLAALDWAPLAKPPPFLQTFPMGLGPRRLGRAPDMKIWLASQAEAGNVDILHNHSLWMMPNVYTGVAAKKFKVPLVLSPHGTLSGWAMASGSPVKRLFWPLAQKPVLDATMCFHATAKAEYEDIRRLGYRQPVAIIPNGIDLPKSLRKVARDQKTMLFLGRLHPVKGLDHLLMAWRAVQHRFPEWRLRIVGPGKPEYVSFIKRQAEQLAVQRVDFTGPCYGADKWVEYASGQLFILPSYSENFGVAVAEALASGLPAIVSKGAPWSGLTEQSAGWWVDNGVDPLVTCLEQALALSDEELQAMGRRGRHWMEQAYAWSAIGKQMAATYQWLMQGGAKPECVIED